MYVILCYDVGSKLNHRMLKACRKYLRSTQHSVLWGFLTDRNFSLLKSEIIKLIDPEQDVVTIYQFPSTSQIERSLVCLHISVKQPQSLLCLMGIGKDAPNKRIVNFAKLTLLAPIIPNSG